MTKLLFSLLFIVMMGEAKAQQPDSLSLTDNKWNGLDFTKKDTVSMGYVFNEWNQFHYDTVHSYLMVTDTKDLNAYQFEKGKYKDYKYKYDVFVIQGFEVRKVYEDYFIHVCYLSSYPAYMKPLNKKLIVWQSTPCKPYY